MITQITIHNRFAEAYEIIRNEAIGFAPGDIGGHGEEEIRFPSLESFWNEEQMIEECEPYVDAFKRITRTDARHRVYHLENLSYQVDVFLDGENISLLIFRSQDVTKITKQLKELGIAYNLS